MNKTFITGVDRNMQDLLPWWIKNIRKHDKETKITVANFGMDPKWAAWAKKHVDTFLEYPKHKKCAWFWKPHTLLAAPYEYKCWLDIDCEVLTDITDIFDYVDGTNIGLTDDPCRRKEIPGEKWLATGVNVVKGKPNLLKLWHKWCQNTNKRGDQEVMHDLLKVDYQRQFIVELPMEYQWLRIQLARGQDNPNKKVIHWTGPVGKDHIRSTF